MTPNSSSKNVDDDRFETVELARKELPDVRFRARLLGEVDSKAEKRDGGRTNNGRWTTLQLWELPNGTWIAAAIGCSDRDGEIDIGDILRIPAAPASLPDNVIIGGPKAETSARAARERARISDAMTFWGWSWLAKKLADKLGWDTIEEIVE